MHHVDSQNSQSVLHFTGIKNSLYRKTQQRLKEIVKEQPQEQPQKSD